MSYQSIEAVQEALSKTTFSERKDSRKAAGRALGTIVELITFYLLKDYGLMTNICIERPLREYANEEIKHNVEFTLHTSKKISEMSFGKSDSLTLNKILNTTGIHFGEDYIRKNNNPYKSGVIKNAATLMESPRSVINAYTQSSNKVLEIFELDISPYAMFECKRVGIEKGMKKGPQTIEKAKQGAYVSRSVSRLQRFKRLDGTISGIIEEDDGQIRIGDYDKMLAELILEGKARSLRDIVVTVGVISNHGNWFTSENQNKETKVLSQSYDWLLFLTDEGLTRFINDALLGDDDKMHATKKAFTDCYDGHSSTKVSFTKTSLPYDADIELTEYFERKRDEIIGWFNVLTPRNSTVDDLMNELKTLMNAEWEEVEFS